MSIVLQGLAVREVQMDLMLLSLSIKLLKFEFCLFSVTLKDKFYYDDLV